MCRRSKSTGGGRRLRVSPGISPSAKKENDRHAPFSRRIGLQCRSCLNTRAGDKRARTSQRVGGLSKINRHTSAVTELVTSAQVDCHTGTILLPTDDLVPHISLSPQTAIEPTLLLLT